MRIDGNVVQIDAEARSDKETKGNGDKVIRSERYQGTISRTFSLASDIDEVAVDVAEANLKANGMEGQVICLEAAGFDHPDLQAQAPYDLIFANILKGPLVALAPDLAANLRPGGYAILSGILNEQADGVVAVYAQNGVNLERRDEIGEWTTLLLRKAG